jgi:death-on-curing protein
MRYLTVDELVYINEQIASAEKIHTIVDGKRKVRDMGLLEAAAARPQATVFGEDAYATPQEKAAALLHSLARNHPFADGNKRTAAIAAIFMLDVNGLRVNWKPEEALQKIVDMAEGKLTLGAFAAWLPVEPTVPTPEQDAEYDMQTIARITAEHRWLLDELAKQ